MDKKGTHDLFKSTNSSLLFTNFVNKKSNYIQKCRLLTE